MPDEDKPVSPADEAAALEEFELSNQALAGQQLPRARRHLQQAIKLNPALAEAHANLGALLKDMGQTSDADVHLTHAVALKPTLSTACFNLGLRRIDQGRWAEAVELLQRVLAREPRAVEAHYWLANALMGLGNMQRARQSYRVASRLQPALVQAQWGYVMAQLPAVAQTPDEQRQAPDAFVKELDRLRAAWRTRSPSELYAAVGAQQPFHLAYIDGNHRTGLEAYGRYCAELMQGWSREAGFPEPKLTSGRKCRVGIVSAHVHSHSVWHALVKGWIQHLDARRFDVHLFHVGANRNGETDWAGRRVAKLHLGPHGWQDWARLIVQTQPDVLIYPEIGMDATTVRLASLRLAPVQLASWGHPISTGLPTIDGFLGAQAFEPAEGATHYSEKLLQLPRLGCCYQPFGTQPSLLDFSGWGVQAADKVLLCAGTPYKYAPQHDAVLAEIARRCAPCKLIFFRDATQALAARLEQRLRAAFASAGVSFDDCVRFIPWQTQAAFFAWLDRADVYLDTIGFSGFNTTMQAIERGTPIVAFEGEFMRGRFASAILRQIGLDAWVATSTDQYVQLVERLAVDPSQHLSVRQQIAERRQQLFDDRDSVTALEQELLTLWQH